MRKLYLQSSLPPLTDNQLGKVTGALDANNSGPSGRGWGWGKVRGFDSLWRMGGGLTIRTGWAKKPSSPPTSQFRVFSFFGSQVDSLRID